MNILSASDAFKFIHENGISVVPVPGVQDWKPCVLGWRVLKESAWPHGYANELKPDPLTAVRDYHESLK